MIKILVLLVSIIGFAGVAQAFVVSNGKDGKDYFIANSSPVVGLFTDASGNEYYVVRGKDGKDYFILKSEFHSNS